MNIRYIVYVCFALLASFIPILMLIHSLRKEKFAFVQFNETGNLRQDWSTCMELNAAKMENTTWIQWPTILNYCEKYLTDNITLVDVGTDIIVMHLTYNKTHHDFVPTILILAERIKAESIENIRDRLKWENMTFLGTEPADVASYTDVGVFFPEKDEPEVDDSRLSPIDFPRPITKTRRIVGRKEFAEFMTNYNLKFYDAIWLDWAVKDYEVLPLTYRGDLLDELRITVCQFHVLIHYGSKVQQIHEFITRTIQEKRYAILRTMPTGTVANSEKYPFAVPLTLFMINIENQECIRRFTPQLL